MKERTLRRRLAVHIAVRLLVATVLLGAAVIVQLRTPGGQLSHPFYFLVGLTYAVSLGFIDGDLPVLGVVAQWRHAADPKALALGRSDLVPDALGGDLPFKLGKRQQHVQGKPTHRGGGVERLRDRDK